MAFRRKAVEEVGYFDEEIQYGFDEVEFADRICRAGYKIVLDPEVSVWHKHRSTFGDFLKQNFQYGKGSGLVFKKNKLNDSVSRWAFLALVGFISWLVIVGTFSYLVLTSSSSLFFWILFGFTGLPLIILAGGYIYRALESKKLLRIVIYPFIDFFRTLSFCFGQVYQLFKKA
jgi:GT2 family glycosyltransferase